MKIKKVPSALFGLLLVGLISLFLVAKPVPVDAISIELTPGEGASFSRVINRSEPFNTLMLTFEDEIEGLLMNTNPLYSDRWEPVEVHDDGFGVEALVFFNPTNVIQFKQVDEVLEEIKFNAEFLMFEGGENPLDQFSGPQLSSSKVRIISRSDWGADESLKYWTPELKQRFSGQKPSADPCADYRAKYPSEVRVSKTTRFDENGEFIWPLRYMPKVQKIALHHTDSELRDLTGDERLDRRDYQAMVQAIYYYHTVRRGWGDIGYHYIIDPLGNVYEGKYGGDRVIGAHALCHNNGTLGVAIIGNYEESSVPTPALNSAIQLLAKKAEQYNIDPKKSSSFRGKNLANIFAHKDVRATSCPGERLYAQLPRVRDRVALTMRTSSFNERDLEVTDLDYNADFLSGDTDLSLNPNGTKKTTLKFKNTGQNTWDQNTWLHVSLNNRKAARVMPVVPDKVFVAADLKESSVRPGDTGTFEVDFEAGYFGGYHQFQLSPVVNGRYKISRASAFVSLEVVEPNFDYEVVKSDLPRGSFFQGQQVQASIKLKNTGNVRWVNYGDSPIRLGTADERDRKSILSDSTRLADLVESEVRPGQTGTFVFNLEMPPRLEGWVIERFAPVIENVTWLKDRNLGFRLQVKKPRHLARLTDRTKVTEMLPGEQKRIELTLLNRGDLPWSNSSMRINLLASGLELFKNIIRPVDAIAPGETGQFSFWVQAPYEAGRHRVSFSSRYQNKTIRGGVGRYLIQVPETRLTARRIEQSEANINLQPNEEHVLEVKYKNLSNAVWQQKGPHAIYLAPSSPQDRKSRLYLEGEWPSQFRAAQMEEEEVYPGETATFRIKIQPQRKGVYKEYFQLVVERVGWIDNSNVRWTLRVFGDRAKSTAKESTLNTNQVRAKEAINRRRNAQATEQRESSANYEPVITKENNVEKSVIASYKPQDEDLFRVLLSYFDDQSTVSFDQPYSIERGGRTWRTVQSGESVKISKTGSRLRVEYEGQNLYDQTIRLTPVNAGIFTIETMERRPSWKPSLNDNQFRGSLELRIIDGKVHYINELPLEDYMLGLAEVSNDTPREKQKAIAVLARSYAQFYMSADQRKFPGKPYDGNDDPNVFQKYLGYGYEKRSPNFAKAVQQTAGQVVTYRGELIKTPYFSQSTGRTLSAKEVWGWTDTPYLTSVDDPYCKGLSQRGHGVGMSGCGSDGMARAGKSFEEIIKYYYNGVAIEAIDN